MKDNPMSGKGCSKMQKTKLSIYLTVQKYHIKWKQRRHHFIVHSKSEKTTPKTQLLGKSLKQSQNFATWAETGRHYDHRMLFKSNERTER